ncbi:hypothetical protein ACIGNX_12975 [Actinosynnema sp. NPDC053489]|uniref:hypothetical protein n=1 Tax=Actinosynnema sp. NPDC053489 TaxID=3363916 RepID=UPI0037CB44D4
MVLSLVCRKSRPRHSSDPVSGNSRANGNTRKLAGGGNPHARYLRLEGTPVRSLTRPGQARTSIRRSTLTAAVMVLITAFAPALPAHAASTCTVNGANRSGTLITGTSGDDTINCSGNVLSDTTVDGLDGNDTITVQTNLGTVNGGIGTDKITISGYNYATANGGPGDDTLSALSNETAGNLRGDTGNDTISVTTSSGINSGAINGDAGNDKLSARTNYVSTGQINGGPGLDEITVTRNDGAIHGNEDADTVTTDQPTNTSVKPTVYGDAGNDTLTVSQNLNGNIVRGDDGDDKINVGTNDSGAQVLGGLGVDTITVTTNRATVDGEAGADAIIVPAGGVNTGTLRGGTENDSFDIANHEFGGNVEGAGGSDTIKINRLRGHVHGGLDGDTVTVTTLVWSEPTYPPENVAHVFGEAGNDTITVDESIRYGVLDGGDGTDSCTVKIIRDPSGFYIRNCNP